MGGVARNLATALQFLGHQPRFLTALARDNLAEFALDQFKAAGFSPDQLKICWSDHQQQQKQQPEQQQSSCFALVLMDSIKGQCEYVIANLETVAAISPRTIEQSIDESENGADDTIRGAPLLVMDANLRADTMETIVRSCHSHRVPIFLEPTDVVALPRLVECIQRLRPQACLESIVCLSPNLFELQRMKDLFEHRQQQNGNKEPGSMSLDAIEELAKDFMANCMPELTCLLVTLDKRGVMVALRTVPGADLDEINLMDPLASSINQKAHIITKHFEPLELIEKPVSASGAGDSFAAGFISGLLDKIKLSECIARGFKASQLALNARDTIPCSLKSLLKPHDG